MAPKPKAHNWNDVQTAIATVTIVTTLGLWNLFATPAKANTLQANAPTLPPTEPPVAAEPTAMPYVKIMFTDVPQQTITSQQTKNNNTNNNNKKKKKNNNGGSVTKTKTS